MIEAIALMIVICTASDVLGIASFHGGVVGLVVNAALARRTARLSMLSVLAEKAEKASVPERRLSPVRLLDKFTIFRSLAPPRSGSFL
jgi:hypothetical protein